MIITGTRIILRETVKASDYGKKIYLTPDSEAIVICANLPNDTHRIQVGVGRSSHQALVSRNQFQVVK